MENLLDRSCYSGSSRTLDLDKDLLVTRIMERCSDKLPVIRAKALNCISTLASLRNGEIKSILQQKLFALNTDQFANNDNLITFGNSDFNNEHEENTSISKGNNGHLQLLAFVTQSHLFRAHKLRNSVCETLQ